MVKLSGQSSSDGGSDGVFCLDLHEVTVEDYRRCVVAGPCVAEPSSVHWSGITLDEEATYAGQCNANHADRTRHPVNCVDWKMAETYCGFVGKRLPAERELTFAARGSEQRDAPWTGDPPPREQANFSGGDDGWEETAPVGSFPRGATPQGVQDLAGNVWEWTSTMYCTSPSWPPVWGTCEQALKNRADVMRLRVVHGGDAFTTTGWPAPVDGLAEETRVRGVGFRCAR